MHRAAIFFRTYPFIAAPKENLVIVEEGGLYLVVDC